MLMRQVPRINTEMKMIEDKNRAIPMVEENYENSDALGKTRLYRVVAVSDNTNSFGLEGIILMRRNGESWEVGRSRYAGHEKLKVGDVVHVAQKHKEGALPSFDGCEIPRRLPDPPEALVKKVWKGATAGHYKGKL